MGHEGDVTAIAFSPDGKIIAGASNGIGAATVHFWDSVKGTHINSFKGSELLVSKVLFHPDGNGVVSSGGGLLIHSDFRTGKEVHRFGISQLLTFALSSDGRRLVAIGLTSRGEGPGRIRLELIVWDAATGKELKQRDVAGKLVPAFSADTTIMALPASHSIAIQEVIAGKEIGKLSREEWAADERMSDVLAFSADAKTLLTATLEEKRHHTTLRLWELASGHERLTIPCSSSGRLTQVALAPDGRTAATACDGETMQVWDLATGKETFRRQGFGVVRSLAFAPNSRLLASGHADGTVLVWELPAQAELNANPERLDARQFQRWWTDLGGADAGKYPEPANPSAHDIHMDGNLHWCPDCGRRRKLDQTSEHFHLALTYPDSAAKAG
jgi:WD40 repeat protein